MRAAPEIHLSEGHFMQSLANPGNIFRSLSTAQKGG